MSWSWSCAEDAMEEAELLEGALGQINERRVISSLSLPYGVGRYAATRCQDLGFREGLQGFVPRYLPRERRLQNRHGVSAAAVWACVSSRTACQPTSLPNAKPPTAARSECSHRSSPRRDFTLFLPRWTARRESRPTAVGIGLI